MLDRITLRVEGLMLERFLNVALAEGARFAAAVREGRRCVRLVTDAAGARRVLALAERYRLNCVVVERRGLRALLRRAERRSTLLVGLAVFAACLALFLSRVWLIDVQLAGDRPTPLDAAALRADLQRLGVFPGMARGAVDVAALERQLAAAADGCAFVGVRLEGVRLLVEAVPEVAAPELYAIDEARDLVAACDGIVVSVNARAGRACVSPGDTVRRGQLLIRGEERLTQEATRGVQALGEVEARTWYAGEAEGARTELRRTYTGRTSTAAALKLLGWQVSLARGEALSPAEAQRETLPVGGLFLPLAIERVTLREYREERVARDEAALKQALAQAALAQAEADVRERADPACRIVERWTDYTVPAAGTLRARAVLEVRQNIAVTRDSLYQGGN